MLFNRDASSEVICRWRHTSSGVLFDLMPTDPAILGFSNRWYPEAVKSATHVRLSDRIVIRVISGPAFVATKLEAFVSRGGVSVDCTELLDVFPCQPNSCSSSHVLLRSTPLAPNYRCLINSKPVAPLITTGGLLSARTPHTSPFYEAMAH